MAKTIKKLLPVIVDTREQMPFEFIGYPVITKCATLATGDYSLAGFTDRLCIERKSLGDLASCMTIGRERFERELERMREFECAAVVVEEPLANIQKGAYRSHLKVQSFFQSILSMTFRYKVPFFFGQNRTHAQNIAFNCMRHFYNHQLPDNMKMPYREYGR
jgi:ERCC4-type nuclease